MLGTHHGLGAEQALSLGDGRQLTPSPPEAGLLLGDELRRAQTPCWREWPPPRALGRGPESSTCPVTARSLSS